MKTLIALFLAIGSSQEIAVSASHPVGAAIAINGDEISIGGTAIRLYGISAPKLLQMCADNHGRAYACGEKARDQLAKWVVGRSTSCAYHGQKAICFVESLDIGKKLLERGLAIPSADAPEAYRQAGLRAKAARVGVWQGHFLDPDQWQRSFNRSPFVRPSEP